MQDTHSDLRKSESHQSHRLCVCLYMRTPKTSNASNFSTCNSFAGLPGIFDHDDEAHVPDFLSTECVEGHMQQCFELMCRNRQEVIRLHRAHGHLNNRTRLLNLETKYIPHKHVKRYFLAVSCDACRAVTGKRGTKRLQ